MSAKEMAAAVDEGLMRNGWFVTGRMDASLFSDDFFFEDPNVRCQDRAGFIALYIKGGCSDSRQ